jgi:DNA repair exonuclease SbcCD ATPase subunit
LLLLLAPHSASYAQDTSTAQQSVESLRSQLRNIEAKQATLEERVRQLDEDLRPENIERSLALTGSTRPEELRDQRRQQLEKEKASAQAQLDQLATSQARLQAALTAAETAAYQQNSGTSTATSQPQPSSVDNQTARSVQPPQPRSTRRRTRRAKVRRRMP